MHEELGTRPGIHYLYETPAVPGRDPTPEDCDDEALADPENPLVGPRQRFWDFRAAANFIFGGMGAGLAVIAGVLDVTTGLTNSLLDVLFVASGALIATGLAFVFFKIGRMARFLYALLRPQSSWMTREIYAVAVFYPSLALDLWRPNSSLHALVVLAALAFLVSQARILFASKGIPAWRAPLIPWMLAITGLLEGAGLAAMLFVFLPVPGTLRSVVAVLGVVLCLVNAGLWHRYRTTAKACGIMPLARREIDAVSPVLHLVGHILPAALFTAAVFAPGAAGTLALFGAGLGAAAGGILWKFVVILRASYQQGFALAKLPRRGSGSYAAPPAFPALAGGR
jgi:phenylacetyl-CoA:acceptor oxidoreductase subunit 2